MYIPIILGKGLGLEKSLGQKQILNYFGVSLQFLQNFPRF